jgi:hypothetical protein
MSGSGFPCRGRFFAAKKELPLLLMWLNARLVRSGQDRPHQWRLS